MDLSIIARIKASVILLLYIQHNFFRVLVHYMFFVRLVSVPFFIFTGFSGYFNRVPKKCLAQTYTRVSIDEIKQIKTMQEFKEKAFPSLGEPILPYNEGLYVAPDNIDIETFFEHYISGKSKRLRDMDIRLYKQKFESYNDVSSEMNHVIKSLACQWSVPVHLIALNKKEGVFAAAGSFVFFDLKKDFVFNIIFIEECDTSVSELSSKYLHFLLHEFGHLQLAHSLLSRSYNRQIQELEADLWASVFSEQKRFEGRKALRDYISYRSSRGMRMPEPYASVEELTAWLEKLEELDPELR